MRKPRTIKLAWRDENYGAHSGATAACRTDMILMTATARQEAGRAMRAAGFKLCESRQAWISYKPDAGAALCTDLVVRGFSITHAGRWPEGPPATGKEGEPIAQAS